MMRSYNEAINYLYDHLPYFQRKGAAAYKASLDTTIALDHLYGEPHRKFRSVHIGGTNGKGSVSHMLASIFQAAGYRTGLYTSPHLKDFRERIRINGEMIEEEYVVDFVNDFLRRNEDARLEPSFFELTVLMAFTYFADRNVDIAIVEVGLGGRLDSTNVIMPDLSVITNISPDHMALLGDTLGKIALEKSGIIKNGVPVVIGETHPQTSMIFEGVAATRKSPALFADRLYRVKTQMLSTDQKQLFSIETFDNELKYKGLSLDLNGVYQRKNILTVLAAVDQLRNLGWNLTDTALYEGLANVVERTGLMGRWQTIGANPRIIADTGHNEAGITEVVSQIAQTPYRSLHMVIGMVNDKDCTKVLSLLPREATYYFTKASIPRATPEQQLQEIAAKFGLSGSCYPTVPEALTAARKNADKDDLIFVGGSTFVVAEIIP